MAKQIINVGTTANDRTGDTIRAAMVKVKSNFDELYSAYGSAGTVPILAAVAKTGDYEDLVNKPNLSVYQLTSQAFSGNYNDLTNKPSIPSVPTVVSSFQNDAGYLSSTQLGVPSTSIGRQGDRRGMTTYDDFHFYFCSAPYDGVTHIWKRIAWTSQQW